jgi:hypothetical protein
MLTSGPSALAAARQPAAQNDGPLQGFRSRPDLTPSTVTVTTAAHGTAPGYVFVSPRGPSQRGPLIVDNQGSPIWFSPRGYDAFNFRVQQYHGKPVVTWWEGSVIGGYGEGEGVIMDSSYRELRRVRAGNGYSADLHELLLTANGTALLTAYNIVDADLTPVGGPKAGPVLDSIVQEIDLSSGKVLLEWHSLANVPLTESRLAIPTGGPFDYFHVNSIDVAPDGNLIVSARNTCAVYKLDRHTGRVIWRLGGSRSDFQMGAGTTFAWQHDARMRPDGTLTIFDDGSAPQVESQSRGIVLALDTRKLQATLAHQYVHPDPLLAVAMGNMQTLPNGDLLVGWGTVSSVSEFGADGTLRFDAQLPDGVQTYRAFRFPWTAQPTYGPAASAVVQNGTAVVYASWNGATEVAHWEVRTASVKVVAARRGFETAIALKASSGQVTVAALDKAGKTLGTAPPIQL